MKNFVEILRTRFLMRAGKFLDAHKLMVEVEPKLPKEFSNSKECYLYLEWVLVSKKVLYKQFF